MLNNEKLSFTTPEDKVDDGDALEDQEVLGYMYICTLHK